MQHYDKNISYENIKYFYESGVYTIEDIIQYVGKIITKDQFHFITSYDFNGYCDNHKIKKIKG